MQQHFKRYMLDTSTEFQLGESVGSQLQTRTEETDRFMEALKYASVNMEKVAHLEKTMSLSRNTK